MRSWFPFTDYDFFGYLSVGGGLLLAFDNALQFGLLVKQSWTWLEVAALIGAAYMVGQSVAALSHSILEAWLVRKVIGRPTNLLMGDRKAPWFWRMAFPRFVEPLPDQTRETVKARAAANLGEVAGEALFLAAHSHARQFTDVQERLQVFVGRYGFFRNACVASLLAAVTWLGAASVQPNTQFVWSAGLAFLFRVVALGRYLTFHRSFSSEVLLSFAFRKRE
jgi:hypothetical protein